MKPELSPDLTSLAAILVTSSGIGTSILAYLGNNAAGIGAGCTIIFGFIYVYFQWSSNKKLTIAEVNEIKIDQFGGRMNGMDNKLSSLQSDVKQILNKLS